MPVLITTQAILKLRRGIIARIQAGSVDAELSGAVGRSMLGHRYFGITFYT
jgi:hypothetical protein